MKIKVSKNIDSIIPYPPGKPLEELEREYGIKGSIKLASNENPWGPSPKAIEAIQKTLSNLHRYPDGSGYYLVEAISNSLGVDHNEVVLGNGSNEVIEFLVKALVETGDNVITSHPSFLMYQKFVQVRGGVNIVVQLNGMYHDLSAILKKIDQKTKLIFLDNPNNPTGTLIPREELEGFLDKVPEHVVVVLDEAYIDFVDMDSRVDVKSLIKDREGKCGVVSLRTFSKAYGIAGLRVGFGLMASDLADYLHRVRQPFNVNLLAQAGALAALEDVEYFNHTLEATSNGRDYISKQVEGFGCIPYPSHTNFFLIDVLGDATKLYDAMLYKGVIVRSMKAYGYPNFIRITIGTEEENERFVEALKLCMKELNYG